MNIGTYIHTRGNKMHSKSVTINWKGETSSVLSSVGFLFNLFMCTD